MRVAAFGFESGTTQRPVRLRCFDCRIVKLVRALRKGWIKREKEEPKEPEAYLLWADDGIVKDKTTSGVHPVPNISIHAARCNPTASYCF